MKAVCWYGRKDVRVENVPDPSILHPRDAVIQITSTAICGSDLHLYDGYIPTMQRGDVLGHEFMGEVVEVGSKVDRLKKGDRVGVRAVRLLAPVRRLRRRPGRVRPRAVRRRRAAGGAAGPARRAGAVPVG